MKINRAVYILLLIGTGVYAWVSGERMLYVAFAVLFALPLVSYVLTYFFLRGLRVSQIVPDSILKGEPGTLTVRLHNTTLMPFGKVDIVVQGDKFAAEVEEKHTAFLRPLKTTVCDIGFTMLYRGHYQLGLASISVTDMVGLFRLRRKFVGNKKIVALPFVKDLSDFPLVMNLMTQAHSRFDIRDEDYSTISDIRQYVPTDSIKRVHWKLTAKRSEWLVKVFQSNALNQVTMILDSIRLDLRPKAAYALEDSMVENALGLAKFCLSKGMPVDFYATEGSKTQTRVLPEFDIIYQIVADLEFETHPNFDSLNILSHVLNEATGYINAVVITAKLNAELYERIVNASNNGHYIAVLYFGTGIPDEDSERICQLLIEGGTPCFRVGGDRV